MHYKNPLFIVAGAKGAVASTVAAAVASMKTAPDSVVPWLTTPRWLGDRFTLDAVEFAGWDVSPLSMTEAVRHHGVLSPEKCGPYEGYLEKLTVLPAPSPKDPLRKQVGQLSRDIHELKRIFPGTEPVLVNLLPASGIVDLEKHTDMDRLYSLASTEDIPDLAYALAALDSGIPIVNFTSNALEAPLVVEKARAAGVPLCGRDGKTGQTYLKVVLASALKARSLKVEGWYSMNILGNEDGKTLSDPRKAAGKVDNKTALLQDILGYRPGERYGADTHKVVIDYYPPRGDCKEAWDVIDITGVFDMPMSLRLDLQARDSILAAPMVVDLGLWMTALHASGVSGLVPELSFYFKKPLGIEPPLSFQDQLAALGKLAQTCGEPSHGQSALSGRSV
jgi:myo-inositol-1-phosphate synthase